jgi:hypothetical protein
LGASQFTLLAEHEGDEIKKGRVGKIYDIREKMQETESLEDPAADGLIHWTLPRRISGTGFIWLRSGNDGHRVSSCDIELVFSQLLF